MSGKTAASRRESSRGEAPLDIDIAPRANFGPARGPDGAGAWTRYLVPLGRAAFAAVFLWFAPGDFSRQGIAWAGQQGVPLAGLLVPLAGLLSLAGGLSVLLGYRARLGGLAVDTVSRACDDHVPQFLGGEGADDGADTARVFPGQPVEAWRRVAHRALRCWALQP